MKFNNLLVITYYFPPIRSIGVIRNFNLVKYFTQYISEITVITTTNQDILPAEPMPTPSSVNIQKAFTFDYRSLMALRKNRNSPHLTDEEKKNWISRFLVKLLRSFPFNLLIGEGGFFYIINGLSLGKKEIIKRNNYTVIYSSFPTFSDHVIAYLLKRRFREKTFWVADFRDLHTDPIYDLVYFRKFQHWCNYFILKKADLITTVSHGLAEQLQKYHPNVSVLQNGVELKDRPETDHYKKFTIAYTGSLFVDERDPTPFLEIIKSLIDEGDIEKSDLQFLYAGKDGERMNAWVDEYQLGSVFQRLGLLSRDEAMKLQEKTHLNLLLSSSHVNMTGVLTGKFFEYLGARNPIILFIKGIKDIEFENIFAELNAGKIAYHNEPSKIEMREYILAAYQKWKDTGSLDHHINLEKLKGKFSWNKSIENLLLDILKLQQVDL